MINLLACSATSYDYSNENGFYSLDIDDDISITFRLLDQVNSRNDFTKYEDIYLKNSAKSSVAKDEKIFEYLEGENYGKIIRKLINVNSIQSEAHFEQDIIYLWIDSKAYLGTCNIRNVNELNSSNEDVIKNIISGFGEYLLK